MTIRRTAYSYSVLKYVHDAITGEFLNVGVVLCAASTREVSVRVASPLLRLQLAFPGCNTRAVQRELHRIEAALKQHPSTADGSFDDLLSSLVPNAARGLQWSKLGAGVSANLSVAINDLFLNFVAKRENVYESFGELDEYAVALTQFKKSPHHTPLLASNEASPWTNEPMERYVASGT
jgi:hypothetical protein